MLYFFKLIFVKTLKFSLRIKMWWFKEWSWSLGNNWSVAIISVNALTCFETLLIWFLFLFYLAHEYDYRRRVISKSFQYQLRLSDKQALVGKFFCFVAFVHFQLHLFFSSLYSNQPGTFIEWTDSSS